MRLTNADLLAALADAGDTGLTVVDLAARLGLPHRESNWRLQKLQRRGHVVKAGTRARRPGERGLPPRVWRVAPLDSTGAQETKLSA